MAPRTSYHPAALLAPLIAVPLLATTVVNGFDAVPAVVKGAITGASIALMLRYCLNVGSELGTKRRRADEQKLRDLDPLGDVLLDEEGQR